MCAREQSRERRSPSGYERSDRARIQDPSSGPIIKRVFGPDVEPGTCLEVGGHSWLCAQH